MEIKTTKEIKAELNRKDMEEMISEHMKKQGYEVIKIVFRDEMKYPDTKRMNNMDIFYGNSSTSTREFAGATVYLKEIGKGEK